jgi:hypothetical protein
MLYSKSACIIVVFGYLGLLLVPAMALGQTLEEASQTSKPERNTDQLEHKLMIQGSDSSNGISVEVITLLGGIATTVAAAFIAWHRERRTPLPAEQEKIIHDIVKAWYNSSYLDVYKAIWNDIQWNDIQRASQLKSDGICYSKSDISIEEKIDYYWRGLCIKEFKMAYFSKRFRLIAGNKSLPNDPNDDKPLIEYLAKKKTRLGLKNKKEIEEIIQHIKTDTEAEYHAWVQKALPEVAEIAVTSALGPNTTIHEKDYDILVEKSLDIIKRLMIFYFLAEDRIVVETLIRSKLTEKFLKLRDSK